MRLHKADKNVVVVAKTSRDSIPSLRPPGRWSFSAFSKYIKVSISNSNSALMLWGIFPSLFLIWFTVRSMRSREGLHKLPVRLALPRIRTQASPFFLFLLYFFSSCSLAFPLWRLRKDDCDIPSSVRMQESDKKVCDTPDKQPVPSHNKATALC